MPEEITSVILGSPGEFKAEHNEGEPEYVYVKPITKEPAQSNLLIATKSGLHVTLELVSDGAGSPNQTQPVDFLIEYRNSRSFLIAADFEAPAAPVTPGKEPDHHIGDAGVRSAAAPLSSLDEEFIAQQKVNAPKWTKWADKQIETSIGDMRHYDVTTVSAVSRQKRDKIIQTGKVLVTCTLTIARLGTHSGSGEQWADEQNAMTSAEAQAFKRSASCFGLGRYLYNLPETWVTLDGQGKLTRLPALPNWALPKVNAAIGKTNPACGPRPPVVQRGPIDQQTTATIEGFRRILGDPIYGEILWRVARARRGNEIPNAVLQANVVDAMERASRGFHKANSLADQIGDTRFVSILDKLRIKSMTTIPRLETLKTLVVELEREAERLAA
jgi:hypothetical protein